MNIETVKLAELIPAPYNPRQMGNAAFGRLCDSLREHGWLEPIVINKDNTIIGGHQRVRAAAALGWTEAPAYRVDVPKEKERLLNVFLNKNVGTFDEKLLFDLLSQIPQIDWGKTGFEASEITQLFDKMAGIAKQEDFDADAELSTIEEPETKLGDIYELGQHRLICGDATDPAIFEKLFAGAKANMCFTDPPYNVAYNKGKAGDQIKNDDLSPEQFELLLRGSLTMILQHTAGAIYCCMSSSEWPTLHRIFEEVGGHWSRTIIWVKDRLILSRADYHTQFEPIAVADRDLEQTGDPILYGWKEGEKHVWNGGRKQSDVWNFKKPLRNADHPTMKPVELVRRAVENSSQIGDIVLDAFMGGGQYTHCRRTVRPPCLRY